MGAKVLVFLQQEVSGTYVQDNRLSGTGD